MAQEQGIQQLCSIQHNSPPAVWQVVAVQLTWSKWLTYLYARPTTALNICSHAELPTMGAPVLATSTVAFGQTVLAHTPVSSESAAPNEWPLAMARSGMAPPFKL